MATGMAEKQGVVHLTRMRDETPVLYGDGGRALVRALLKAADGALKPSRQGVTRGTVPHPFKMRAAVMFQVVNPHHGSCILTKAQSIVGLGFRTPEDDRVEADKASAKAGIPSTTAPAPKKRGVRSKAAKILDPMCNVSLQDVLNDCGQDFESTGNAYMEVVRDGDTEKPGGLYHLAAPDVSVEVESAADFHYSIHAHDGQRRFARMGDLEGLKTRLGARARNRPTSEVIHFRQSTAMSRYYGFPDWLPAVASIELVHAMHQHMYDFYLNRGVPEFMLFFVGKKIAKPEWDKITKAMQAQIGKGNSRKSIAANITCNPDELEVILHKMAMEGKGDAREFSVQSDTLALEIVSAHRVPPLLAGIMIPGKLGATNELPNALQAFQLLNIAPKQHLFQSVLANTLGNPEVNGGLGLTEEDFTFRTILDDFDLGQMDTAARMRTPLATAQAQGRKLDEGLKKALRNPEKAGQIVGALLSAALVHATEDHGQRFGFSMGDDED